ncbi:MAG: tetratricopeptide repeat protein [Chloroflexaceae bacterium]|jgi:tetratricopeptide (TPR) repeat protein|nr:tetratricopeptide repeat protein [Chloroflexaceae bacterium]
MPRLRLVSGASTYQGTVEPPTHAQRQQGLRAFNNGRFDQAIEYWSPLADGSHDVTAALAEAYFRQALARPINSEPNEIIADLTMAQRLAPADMRFQYHLALALHRAGHLTEAARHYRSILQRDSRWPGIGLVYALALLEQQPQAGIAALPSSSILPVSATLAPLQALLRGDIPPSWDADPMARLWHGLGLVRLQHPLAFETLSDSSPLPSLLTVAVRYYYQGVAAIPLGERNTALKLWRRAYEYGLRQPWLMSNLANLACQQIEEQLAEGQNEAAASTALLAIDLPPNSNSSSRTLVQALDRGAYEAATQGNWARAATLWEYARRRVSAAGLGSPRPLWRNLALAYEAQEQWLQAARSWRAVLRTRPRPSSASNASLTDEQWQWIHRRAITCYQKADAPMHAAVLFRQLIKQRPDDMELRFHCTDALIANKQVQAAVNELRRLLERDPTHLNARLRLAAIHHARGELQAAERSLREALRHHPDHTDVQRSLARVLLDRATQRQGLGHLGAALKDLEEGARLHPTEPQFFISMARVHLSQNHADAARNALAHACSLAANRPRVYRDVLACWVASNNLAEAKRVLALAQADLPPDSDTSMGFGMEIVNQTTPPKDAFTLPAPPVVERLAPWSKLAQNCFDQALALHPNDARRRGQLALELFPIRPDMAERYAGQAAAMAPNEPLALMLHGLTLALNNQKNQAHQLLKQAAQLANRQERVELARHILGINHHIDDPFLHLWLQTGHAFALEDNGRFW